MPSRGEDLGQRQPEPQAPVAGGEPGRLGQPARLEVQQQGPPAQVKIVELPGLPDKGDVVEYIDARVGKAPDTIRADVAALSYSRRLLICLRRTACWPGGAESGAVWSGTGWNG